ncbi:hypothetical protein FAVG1_10797 [Fusarium avenaceum]|nr:hypothetical protein FAVG1_10797 [Fusarium avenaceum]
MTKTPKSADFDSFILFITIQSINLNISIFKWIEQEMKEVLGVERPVTFAAKKRSDAMQRNRNALAALYIMWHYERKTDNDSNANEYRFVSIEDRLKAIEAHIWRNASAEEPPVEDVAAGVVIIDDDDDDQQMAESPNHDSPVSPTPEITNTTVIPSLEHDAVPVAVAATSTISASSTPSANTANTPVNPGTTNPRFFHNDPTPGFPLPEWLEAKAVASIYFSRINEATQLFVAARFMKMLKEFYFGPPENRNKVTWSAINVVLALEVYMTPSKDTTVDPNAAICIRRAQSIMDQLVYRTEDLLGLQVILGIAMFFMHTAHPHPACVLIATAVKLVHRLKLNVPPETAAHRRQSAERARLFWLTYTMDRELSLRTSEPYLLQDHDIGIEIDHISSGPGKGCVLILPDSIRDSPFDAYRIKRQFDEAVKINIPKTRARLAIIQGKIYDQVYSVRASRMSSSEKQQALEGLDSMLEDWYSSLPPSFNETTQSFSISVHITYYQCLFSARRATIHNTDWIKQLDDYASSKTRLDATQRALLLPSNWSTLVEAARSCLTMLSKIPSGNTALRWSSTCVCEAAITVLAANHMTLGLHDVPRSIKEDEAKIDTALKEFEERLQGSNDEFLNKMYTECKSLSERAAVAADKFLDAAVDQFWDAVVDGVIGQTAPQAMAFINGDRAP